MSTVRLALAAAAVAAFLAVPRAQTPSTADATAIVGAARAALGGDAALDGVTSFVLTGALTRSVGGMNISYDLEIDCVLPDQFLRTTKGWISAGPLGNSRTTSYDGFSGDQPLHAVVAPDSPVPPPIQTRPTDVSNPEDDARRDRARVLTAKRTFAEWILPRFMASTTSYATRFTTGGPFAPDHAASQGILDVTGADGFHWSLFVDQTSHLPSRLTWSAKPIVTMTTSSRVAVDSTGRVRGNSPPVLPPGDPTAGLSNVQWRIDLSDYRTVDGLTWPFRIKTSFGGTLFEDVKVSKIRINVPIDAKVFRPAK